MGIVRCFDSLFPLVLALTASTFAADSVSPGGSATPPPASLSMDPASANPTKMLLKWYERGVVYQIYPRSFQDHNGDGIGDLAGITQRIPYLKELGIDAIWISPFYPSPLADFGYDISDFTGVDPTFGTLADFDDLIAAAKNSGIEVVLDYVPNHTSEQHPWFIESRSSRNNPKRDWYLWRDPAPNGDYPNNWRSLFDGRAWTLDERTGQHYYHAFFRQQPDLNWRNPAVRAAMLDVLRFWLDRGVGGFRMDALRHLIKDDQYRDNPPNPAHVGRPGDYGALLPVFTSSRPEMHGILREFRALADRYGDKVLMGELQVPLETLMRFYGSHGDELQMPCNFHLLATPWEPPAILDLIVHYESLLPPGAWPNWVLGNHDVRRLATRLGPEHARNAALLLLTLRGTPTIYNGDEIGMPQVPVPPEQTVDRMGRDPDRSPMRWQSGAGGGFTTGKPWLPMGEVSAAETVAGQARDPRSLLSLYRRLLAFRRATPALYQGDFLALEATDQVLAYARQWQGETDVIVINFGDATTYTPTSWSLVGDVVFSNEPDFSLDRLAGTLTLPAHAGVVVRLASGAKLPPKRPLTTPPPTEKSAVSEANTEAAPRDPARK